MNRLAALALLSFGWTAFAQDPAAAEQPAMAADGGTAVPKAAADQPPAPDVSKLKLNADSIQLVVESHQGEIQDCYEAMLATRHKAPEGVLMTSWVISREGAVKSPRVETKGSTLHDHDLGVCVVKVISGMQFPKPGKKRDQPI